MRTEQSHIISNFSVNWHLWNGVSQFVSIGNLPKAEFKDYKNLTVSCLIRYQLSDKAGICTMDSEVPQHFPYPGMFCTSGNISQCQWLILEQINCLRKWTHTVQMTNPDKWQKLLISVHLCSKWLQNCRFEVGTGCQSSTACANAHQIQPEYPVLPFSTV